jgi:NTE family protein
MTAYQQNLSEIFEKQEHPRNLILFQKIILLAREGLLQVNGQFPDSSKTLFENLIEGHSFVVDLTQLDPSYRYKLKTWLLDPHQNQCSYSFWEGYVNNDHRGYTVEVPLSWWGRFYNWLFGSVETSYWPLATKKNLNPDFQLHGFTLQTGKQGWLFEFKHTHLENLFSFKKNKENLEKARNSRRIVLTPGIVDKLVKVNKVDDRIYHELNEPHPLSIDVLPSHKDYRYQAMAEFRKTEFIEENLAWYVQLWRWMLQFTTSLIKFVVSLWQDSPSDQDEEKTSKAQPLVASTQHVLFENEQIRITKQNGVYQVREIWSGYKNLVCSGGGGKIFSLVGGYRACREMGIPFTAYAGSSAGAIMSILAYLNYEPEQVEKYFADFNREVLLYNEWDKTGYSKTTALKAGLDYVIGLKVLEIINRYHIDKSEDGRKFLNDEVFNLGKITFRSLANLKKRYPDCGLGDELIITASNLEAQRASYFSLKTTPDLELSHAGEMSGSIPPLYKPPEFQGVPHTDGGLTSNFPTEAFIGHDKSLLSSRYGYSIESLGFCFDNGTEEGMLNGFRQRIYRESWLANWFYQLISGIQDPVSAWEWDRIKMVQQSFTTVLLHADVPSTQFSVPTDKQKELVEKGYQETMRHLNYLYSKNKHDDGYHPSQLMFESFQSIEAILVHCCFRQNKPLFDQLVPIAKQHGVSQKRIDLLARRFDLPDANNNAAPNALTQPTESAKSKISKSLSNLLISRHYTDRMRFFIYIYPIFLRMRLPMFANKTDYDLFCKARHGTSINNPFFALSHLKQLNSKQHLVLFLVIYCLKKFHYNKYDELCAILKNLSDAIIAGEIDLNSPKYLNVWSTSLKEHEKLNQILDFVKTKNWSGLDEAVESIQNPQPDIQPSTAQESHVVDSSNNNLVALVK